MSEQTFSVGEIAVLIDLIDEVWRGSEVQIDGPLDVHPCMNVRTGESFFEPVYPLHLVATGASGFAPPRCLRKRRPPQDWKTLCDLTDLPREEMA